jgi:hypothetical protein
VRAQITSYWRAIHDNWWSNAATAKTAWNPAGSRRHHNERPAPTLRTADAREVSRDATRVFAVATRD